MLHSQLIYGQTRSSLKATQTVAERLSVIQEREKANIAHTELEDLSALKAAQAQLRFVAVTRTNASLVEESTFIQAL